MTDPTTSETSRETPRETRPGTGRAARFDGQPAVSFERRFRAPIDDVWAAVTESSRMERWIGTWTGDPGSGSVHFSMNAEGDGDTGSNYEIVRCEPPRSLVVRAVNDFGVWHLSFDLMVDGDQTVLTFTQVVDDPGAVENTGPGWEYYLDRLVAAETGGDVASIDWDRDYYPALREHYLAVAGQLG